MVEQGIGVVVQLVRIPACHAGGRGFESRPLRQGKRKIGAKAPILRLPVRIFQPRLTVDSVGEFYTFCKVLFRFGLVR